MEKNLVQGKQDLLQPIAHGIPHTGDCAAVIQPAHPFGSPHIPRHAPRRRVRARGDLCAALDELCRRADDEGGETARDTG